MENTGLALTNLFLGLFCMLYAKYSWQNQMPITLLKNNITWLYASIALMCLFSFLMFGFYNMPNGHIHGYIKQSLLLSSSFVFYFILTIILTLKMPLKPRKARALLLIPTLIYALLTFQWPNFTYVNMILAPILGALIYLMFSMYRLNKNKQLLLGITGFFLLFSLTLSQYSFERISSPFFFLFYTPLVLSCSFFMYRGIAFFSMNLNKTGLQHIIANNNLNSLTSTHVFQLFQPKTIEDIQGFFKELKKNIKIISFSSSGYSIGGHQLIENGIVIYTKKINKVEFFDSVNGVVKVDPSMSWHQLISYLNRAQKDNPNAWVPKQLPSHFLDYSIAGAVSANIHGNTLFGSPLIKDVESIDLMDLFGQVRRIHRKTNNELFKLAIGGYGLFGLITGIELNLTKKRILQRKVNSITVKDLPNVIKQHAEAGCLNFELQLNVNENEHNFLQNGILSSYFPIEVDPKTIQVETYHDSIFDRNSFTENLFLLVNNKSKKINLEYNLLNSKNDLYYWSNHIVPYFPLEKNLNLLNLLFPEYRDLHLIKQEYYLPIEQINAFLAKLSAHKICREFNLIQARITLSKKDEESYLFWSKQDYVVLNLSFHIPNSNQSLAHIKDYLLELTELSIYYHGSFSLGYIQCYEKNHLLKCYPQITDFLNLKLKHDPSELIQSNWYQSIKRMLYGIKNDTSTITLINKPPLQKRNS